MMCYGKFDTPFRKSAVYCFKSRRTSLLLIVLISLATFAISRQLICKPSSVEEPNPLKMRDYDRFSEYDPDFYPGRIDELCHSDSGGEKWIFFIETSGQACLRPRQACAIESAAITNPDMTVFLYMASEKPPGIPEMDHGEGLERNCRTMELLEALPNVQVLREDLPTNYLMGTPIESLLKEAFNQSRYSYQHMSDAVRIALLHRYGGIYLDLDVIVLRSLRCLRNTAGHVSILGHFCIENDVLAFDRDHKLLNFFMRWMKLTFKANERSTIGPNGLADAFRMFCKIPVNRTISEEHEESFMCHNDAPFKLIPPDAFHPIRYLEQSLFFDVDFPKSVLHRLKKSSYTVHVYGSGHGAHVPKSSLFAFLAQRFCPSIYGESLSNSYYTF